MTMTYSDEVSHDVKVSHDVNLAIRTRMDNDNDMTMTHSNEVST